MIVIVLTLFSYIFNPSVTENEKRQLIKKFEIGFALKRIPKVSFSEKTLIELYDKGKYKKYIKKFNELKTKFIYIKNNNIDYEKLYLYYTLSLKILSKNKDYQNSICLIKSALNDFKNLPPFILREFNDDCRTLKEISIEGSGEVNFYINGLPVLSDTVYVDDNTYNLTVCKNNDCKYIKTKSSLLNKNKYLDFFKWKIKKGLYISDTIPESFFRYYHVKQVHYFYKKNKKLFHKVKLSNGVILLEEEIILKDNKNTKKLKDNFHSKKENEIPVYKKWYFYVGAVALIGITAGGIYWFGKTGEKNTSVTWQ